MPPYLHGDNYLLIATDITDLKQKEIELNELIGKLVSLVDGLRALRIDNIDQVLEVKGKKNKLEAVNNKLYKEIVKLNSVIVKLKEKQKESKIPNN